MKRSPDWENRSGCRTWRRPLRERTRAAVDRPATAKRRSEKDSTWDFYRESESSLLTSLMNPSWTSSTASSWTFSSVQKNKRDHKLKGFYLFMKHNSGLFSVTTNFSKFIWLESPVRLAGVWTCNQILMLTGPETRKQTIVQGILGKFKQNKHVSVKLAGKMAHNLLSNNLTNTKIWHH